MPFAYRHQPLKTIYGLYVFLSLIFLRLPFWIIRYLLPSWRPVPSWSLIRVLIVKSLRVAITFCFNTSLSPLIPAEVLPETPGFSSTLNNDSVPSIASSGATNYKRDHVWIDAKPELVVGEIKDAAMVNNINAQRVAGFWYGKRGLDGDVGQPAGRDEKVIYELHGGGYVARTASPKGESAYFCDEALKYLNIYGYSRAFQVEYRLSQSAPFPVKGAFPAALIDAMHGYDYLVNTLGFKPSNILITGESAGAHLALSLARYIIHAGIPSLSSPRGLFLHSPTVDWGNTHFDAYGPESSMQKNTESDCVHEFMLSGYPIQSLLGNLSSSDAYLNPWISPASLRISDAKLEGLFSGLPPTLIIAGAVEMTLDPMKTLYERMKLGLGEEKVKYVEVANATHAFMVLRWHEPENSIGYEEFARWVGGL